jgi:hypothetical protein
MSAHTTASAPPPAGPPARIGVGIDTSRYGHYAAFLRDDQQPAAAELPFPESAACVRRPSIGCAPSAWNRRRAAGQRRGTVKGTVELA